MIISSKKWIEENQKPFKKLRGINIPVKKELGNPETISNAMGNEHFTKQGDPGNQKPFGNIRIKMISSERWIERIEEIQKPFENI